jgi:hypothetical protein
VLVLTPLYFLFDAIDARIHQQSSLPSSSTVLRGHGGVAVGDRWIMRVRQLSSPLDKDYGRSNECLGANALP